MIGLPAFKVINFIKSIYNQTPAPPTYQESREDSFNKVGMAPPRYLPNYAETELDTIVEAGPSSHKDYRQWTRKQLSKWSNERENNKTKLGFDAWVESNYRKREKREKQERLERLRDQHRREYNEIRSGTRKRYSDEVETYRREIIISNNCTPEAEIEDHERRRLHFPFDRLE